MYYKITLSSPVRVPPNMFGKDLASSMKDVLDKDYVGRMDNDMGIIIGAIDVGEVGESYLVPGDGAAYYDATFTLLTYKPKLQEVVEGEVREAAEFGAFLSIGPIDGLVHVSQIMDDFVNYNDKENVFGGKESKRTLKLGDLARARLVTVSKKSTLLDTKIGLTMRQPGLGAIDWLDKDAKEGKEEKKSAGKEAKTDKPEAEKPKEGSKPEDKKEEKK